ncbi:MAG: cobalamin B12-binding domain-containing protein, partial [Candidatus Omnitrophica bacterium]|nr:cobalamin B12-binding domain-containing protein [Candidatus Omnitrophota bacterium]
MGYRKNSIGHYHHLRDWSGAYTLGYIPLFPLDLAYAAAYLREYGHDVRIVEASIKHLSTKDVLKVVHQIDPDFIHIPTTYFSLDDDKDLASSIRLSKPEIKIIFSGPGVTYNPSLALVDKSADAVTLGEIEDPLLRIAEGRFDKNIAYNKDGRIVLGERSLL